MTNKGPQTQDDAVRDACSSPLKPTPQIAKDFLMRITRRWPEVCEGAQLEVKGPAQ